MEDKAEYRAGRKPEGAEQRGLGSDALQWGVQGGAATLGGAVALDAYNKVKETLRPKPEPSKIELPPRAGR